MNDEDIASLTARTLGVLERIEDDLNAQPDEYVVVTAAASAGLGGAAIIAVSMLDVDYRLYRDGRPDGAALSLGARPLPPALDSQVRTAMADVMAEAGRPTYQISWPARSGDVPEAGHPEVDDPIVALAIARLMDDRAGAHGRSAGDTRH